MPPCLRVGLRKLQGGRRVFTTVTGYDAVRLSGQDLAHPDGQTLLAGSTMVPLQPFGGGGGGGAGR